jgi:hypothetical protein
MWRSVGVFSFMNKTINIPCNISLTDNTVRSKLPLPFFNHATATDQQYIISPTPANYIRSPTSQADQAQKGEELRWYSMLLVFVNCEKNWIRPRYYSFFLSPEWKHICLAACWGKWWEADCYWHLNKETFTWKRNVGYFHIFSSAVKTAGWRLLYMNI